MVQKLWKEQQQCWFEFGNDKRTAHYKITQRMRREGGDKYYLLQQWSEFGVSSVEWHEGEMPSFEFLFCKAIVHYIQEGIEIFKIEKFRLDYTNQKIRELRK